MGPFYTYFPFFLVELTSAFNRVVLHGNVVFSTAVLSRVPQFFKKNLQ